MARTWLVKTEPSTYSIDDLARDGSTGWEGVRNYLARNHLREMALGDLVVVYHSNAAPPAAVGLARVVRTAYPDPTQHDPSSDYYDDKSPPAAPRWDRVDLGFVEKWARPIPLDVLKADPALAGLELVRRGSRLSVFPVSEAHFAHLCALAAAKLEKEVPPMPEDDKKDSLLDDAAARLAATRERIEAEARAASTRAAVGAATSAAASAASRAGEGLLDALETALFGKVGEADKVLRREATADPLERLRAQYGRSGDEVEQATAPPAPVKATTPTVEDRLAKAKIELERLKAAKAAAPEDAPPKKTL